MLRFVAIGVLVYFLQCGTCLYHLRGQDKQSQSTETPSIEIRAEAAIAEFAPGNMRAPFNLGPVPAGETISLKLTVHNTSGEDFNINRLVVVCACIKANNLTNVIASQGSADFELTLQTAPQSKTPRQVYSVFVYDSQDRLVDLHMTYELAGLMCFVDQAVYAKLAPDDTQLKLRIPMLITEPASPKNAVINCTGDLADLDTSIEQSEGKYFLVGSAEIGKQAFAGFGGEIRVTEPLSGRECSIKCLIQRERDVTISPSILRFRRDPDNESQYAATSLIRLHPSLLKLPEGRRDSPPAVLIECTCQQGLVSASSVQVTEGVYRVLLILTKSDKDVAQEETNGEESTVLHWHIKSTAGSFQPVSRLVLGD